MICDNLSEDQKPVGTSSISLTKHLCLHRQAFVKDLAVLFDSKLSFAEDPWPSETLACSNRVQVFALIC